MNNYEHLTDKIEAYVTNQLSENEKLEFEELLKNDSNLKELVVQEQSLANLVLEHDLVSLRAKIGSEIDKSQKNEFWNKVAIVAAIVAISSAVFYFYPKNDPKSEQNLPTVSDVKTKIDSVQNNEIILSNKKEANQVEIPKETSKPIIEKTPENVLAEKVSVEVKEPIAKANPIGEPVQNVILDSKSRKETETKKDSVKNKCLFEKVEAKLVVSPSQKAMSNGKIQIKLPSQVADKLTYSLNKNEAFVKGTQFVELSKGNYLVLGRDLLGCEYELGKTTVGETNCVSEYPKTFSPEIEAAWNIPVQQNENALVEIKGKSGQNVFHFNGNVGNELLWNGEIAGNGSASIGVYKAFVTYSNGEVCMYSVTLFR